MAEAHLRDGHDVVVPQFLGRLPFIDTLAGIAQQTGSTFREVILRADDDAIVERFRARRSDLAAMGHAHPQEDVDDAGHRQGDRQRPTEPRRRPGRPPGHHRGRRHPRRRRDLRALSAGAARGAGGGGRRRLAEEGRAVVPERPAAGLWATSHGCPSGSTKTTRRPSRPHSECYDRPSMGSSVESLQLNPKLVLPSYEKRST